MKLDVQQVFCEVISGVGLVVLIAGVLDLVGSVSLTDFASLLKKTFDSFGILGVLVGAYLLGVVLDAAGLVIDEQLFYRFAERTPTAAQREIFFRNVSSHMLDWNTSVWNYYFCFRNLLVLSIPSAFVWGILVSAKSLRAGLLVVVGIGVVATIFFLASRSLLSLYYEVMLSVGSATSSDNRVVEAGERA